MKKIGVIIYGPPGAGKGTQADLLTKHMNLVHFDIGAYISEVINDPKNGKNKKIQEQKKVYDTGGICDPLWVARLATARIKEIADLNFGVVLSGSMRTILETIGDNKTPGFLEVLENAYGKKNLFFFLLKVQSEVSVSRNSARLICTVCRKTVLRQYLNCDPKGCPACGGPLRKRTDDDPKVILNRLKAYAADTEPVFQELKNRGYKITEINGDQAPYLANKEIFKKL